MNPNERLNAFKQLQRLFKHQIPLSSLMQEAAEMTPWTKALCFGVCRHWVRLEVLADLLMKKRPDSREVWLVILMGLYQLQYMKQPDYAVVAETVALVTPLRKPWAKGLVNAVLRTFCREQEVLLQEAASSEAFIYGHPPWLIARLKTDWPTHWAQILQANDTHPPMSLRVNLRQSTRDAYLACLQQAGINAIAHTYCSEGLTLETPMDVQDLPGFASGAVSVQDESAQLAASLLQLAPGLRVLDACAAPGGKTCHILETQPDLKACVALELDPTRLVRVQDNLTRLGLQATLIQGDARFPERWWDGVLFDRILLDAPCSALGVVRRNPDIKLLRHPEDIEAIVQIQRQLLEALWPLLQEQGLLIYATCSVLPVENEAQIAAFKAAHCDCVSLPAEHPWAQVAGSGSQRFPEQGAGDGFFYSVLLKHRVR